jgi:CheY-like chemotaxis protein
MMPTQGLQVLLVEDHEDTANTTAQLLRMKGHEVRVASSGTRALEVARESVPEVVVLDIGLPDIDGYELARILRDGPPRARKPLVIAVTGRGQEEDRQRGSEAGIELYLVKPVDPMLLFSVLERFKGLLVSVEPKRDLRQQECAVD